MSFQQCEFNFGRRPFAFPPPGVTFQCFNDRAHLDDEQKIILPRHLKLQQLRALSVDEGACSICCDHIACITLKPCGHRGFCERCSHQLERCPLCRATIVIRDHHSTLKPVPSITDPSTSSQSFRQSSSTLTQSHSNSSAPSSSTAPPTSSMYLGLRTRSRSGSVSPGNASVLSPSPGAVSPHPAGTTPSGGDSVGSGRTMLSVVSSPIVPTTARSVSSVTSNNSGEGSRGKPSVSTSSGGQSSKSKRSPATDRKSVVGGVLPTSSAQFVSPGHLYSPSSSSTSGTAESSPMDVTSSCPNSNVARLSSSSAVAPPAQLKRSTRTRSIDSQKGGAPQDLSSAHRSVTPGVSQPSSSSVPQVYVSPSCPSTSAPLGTTSSTAPQSLHSSAHTAHHSSSLGQCSPMHQLPFQPATSPYQSAPYQNTRSRLSRSDLS